MRQPARWRYNYQADEKVDQFKTELCHLIKRSARRQGYDQGKMAYHMGTSQSNASLVDNLKIKKLTVSQLFRYLVNLEPELEFLISI